MLTGTKKLSLIILFVLLVLTIVNIAWWLYYQRTAEMLDTQLSRRLKAIASTGAGTISNQTLTDLLLYDFTAFVTASNLLESMKNADSLSEVFILDESYHLLASSKIQPDSIYFLGELNGPYLDSLFYFGINRALATESYKTGSVYLKSAFAPLTDEQGTVKAVLGVEASVDYFDTLNELKQNLYWATALSLTGGVIIGLLFLLLQRKINNTEQQLFLNETHAYLGRMVAVVSHEIKNPLMIIRASAERLRKKTDQPEAEFVIEEVDRLNQIVTGYLEFATNKEKLTRTDSVKKIQLRDFLDNCREHFEKQYIVNEIKWEQATPPDDNLVITTYPRSLRQVILNLLINGADACRAAGKPIHLGLSASQTSHAISIVVTDFGSGLSKAEIKKLFTPFYTTKTEGSGLGLYLSKKIIEEMGGMLHLTSEKQNKTTITISLPKEIT